MVGGNKNKTTEFDIELIVQRIIEELRKQVLPYLGQSVARDQDIPTFIPAQITGVETVETKQENEVGNNVAGALEALKKLREGKRNE